MAEIGPVVAALLAVVTLLLLGAAVVALRAALDARGTGMTSIAVLAPLAEGARLVRTRTARARPAEVVGGALLLLAPAVRVLALPLAGPALLGAAPGLGWFVVADAIWWVGAGLLAGRRVLPAALALEAPLLLALASPAVAVGSVRITDVAAGRLGLPLAVEAPVAFLLILVVGGVLLPWAVQPATARLGGSARLLAGAGAAAQVVAASATASLLLLGAGPGVPLLVAATAILGGVLVLAARRFPVLALGRLARLGVVALLPLAAVQLGIVVALSLLAR
ncbi:hypothetical protein [Amnibacterium kyonggiense]|uniref:Uncharacterized protein n=1 Tax=Amnibacterium kyonggiense TaxID=595671 RepID=A0A4R7FSB9_9MICO|nr:hypothetical protein [Amnibacterium kyonggiense]TDS80720.1 hypothetical protein CLV52_1287 [Amnibacterium kyonggiense]